MKRKQMLALRYRHIVADWLGISTNRGFLEHRRAIFACNIGGRTFVGRNGIDLFIIQQFIGLGRVTFRRLLLQISNIVALAIGPCACQLRRGIRSRAFQPSVAVGKHTRGTQYGFFHHGFVFQAKCFGSADIGCGGKLAAATAVAFKSARLAVGSMDDGPRQRGLADIALATMRAVNGEPLLPSAEILNRGGFSF